MRWPEKTRRKQFPRLVYVVEYAAAAARTIGIALFFIILLLQLKPWLETGVWPAVPVRTLLVEWLQVPFFVQLDTSYALDPSSPSINFFELIVQFFLLKFPLSLALLIVGKVISMYLFWMVDHVFPVTQVQETKGFMQTGKKIVNIK
jgi:hypothetical protein